MPAFEFSPRPLARPVAGLVDDGPALYWPRPAPPPAPARLEEFFRMVDDMLRTPEERTMVEEMTDLEWAEFLFTLDPPDWD